MLSLKIESSSPKNLLLCQRLVVRLLARRGRFNPLSLRYVLFRVRAVRLAQLSQARRRERADFRGTSPGNGLVSSSLQMQTGMAHRIDAQKTMEETRIMQMATQAEQQRAQVGRAGGV